MLRLLSAAATVEVRTPNRGETGTMVLEPAFAQAAPGDMPVLVPTGRGHDAATAAAEALRPKAQERPSERPAQVQ